MIPRPVDITLVNKIKLQQCTAATMNHAGSCNRSIYAHCTEMKDENQKEDYRTIGHRNIMEDETNKNITTEEAPSKH